MNDEENNKNPMRYMQVCIIYDLEYTIMMINLKYLKLTKMELSRFAMNSSYIQIHERRRGGNG